MSKNPAVLFYTSDFLVGTILMSLEQRGAYITLLCLQHQKGRLSKSEVEKITSDKDVLEKFVVDEEGNYYNQRMEEESQKRVAHREQQRKNIEKRWNQSGNTTVLPLENENEKENNNGFVSDINNNATELSVTKPSKADNTVKNPIVVSWRTSFDTYRAEEQAAYNALRTDADWLATRQRYHHALDIILTLEKAHLDFWNTEEGWKYKRKSRANTINWQRTFENAIDMRSNWVYKPRATAPPSGQSYRERKAAQECPSDTSANLPIIDIEQYNKTEAVQ